jgi:hypothetical protein
LADAWQVDDQDLQVDDQDLESSVEKQRADFLVETIGVPKELATLEGVQKILFEDHSVGGGKHQYSSTQQAMFESDDTGKSLDEIKADKGIYRILANAPGASKVYRRSDNPELYVIYNPKSDRKPPRYDSTADFTDKEQNEDTHYMIETNAMKLSLATNSETGEQEVVQDRFKVYKSFDGIKYDSYNNRNKPYRIRMDKTTDYYDPNTGESANHAHDGRAGYEGSADFFRRTVSSEERDVNGRDFTDPYAQILQMDSEELPSA